MSIKKRTYRTGKCSWFYVFDAPGSTRGSRKQITESGFGTKREAETAEAERRISIKREHELGKMQNVAPVPKTLGALLEEFFREHGEKRLALKTLERYREQASYLSPALLAISLADVVPMHLSREWNRLLQSGGRNRKTKVARPLSTKTVRNIAGVVSSAFTRGIRWGLVANNPVPHSEPPVPKKNAGLALTPSQQNLLIEAADSTWGLAAFLELDAATGARRGELLALRWADISCGNIVICRSLSQTRAGLQFKSTKSGLTRNLKIPESTRQSLENHRKTQKQYREQFGPTYRSDLDLVFSNSDGSPLKPDSVSAAVSTLFHKLKLPKAASLHSLRHSHGSHLLANGVPLPDVSRRLGHSSVYVTATVYAHVMPGGDEEAVRKWEEYQKRSVAENPKIERGKSN
jgi:integrase